MKAVRSQQLEIFAAWTVQKAIASMHFTNVIWGKTGRIKSVTDEKTEAQRELFHVWVYYGRLF